jgi:hypothetical protein
MSDFKIEPQEICEAFLRRSLRRVSTLPSTSGFRPTVCLYSIVLAPMSIGPLSGIPPIRRSDHVTFSRALPYTCAMQSLVLTLMGFHSSSAVSKAHVGPRRRPSRGRLGGAMRHHLRHPRPPFAPPCPPPAPPLGVPYSFRKARANILQTFFGAELEKLNFTIASGRVITSREIFNFND